MKTTSPSPAPLLAPEPAIDGKAVVPAGAAVHGKAVASAEGKTKKVMVKASQSYIDFVLSLPPPKNPFPSIPDDFFDGLREGEFRDSLRDLLLGAADFIQRRRAEDQRIIDEYNRTGEAYIEVDDDDDDHLVYP